MSDPEKYTVGWICANAIEATAAWAFLDEVHEGLKSQPVNDDNDYTLGRIGKHNVVIALLSIGSYGTTAAATVARDMLRTFHNLRIGLTVGIGGGAPSRKNDIRLGDVVVGVPTTDGQGGILPFDFGKDVQETEGQQFRMTGHCNQPPRLLLTAVSRLAAEANMEGYDIQSKVDNVLGSERAPKIRRIFKRPDLKSDRLYRSEIIHPSGTVQECVDVCGRTEEVLVIRAAREEDEENPKVHYGLIASGNRIIHNSSTRDKLSRTNNVLCFETAAAGVVSHFPCLVIRGICDYSDSHNNKQWQGYAAMTAAAYAKELLKKIPPVTVGSQNTMSTELLKNINRLIEEVVRLQTRSGSHEESDILNWLVDDYYVHQHTRNLALRCDGTGEWFLQSPEFVSWKTDKGRTLLCHGVPKSGKTILASILTENLLSGCNRSETGIAYMYLDYEQRANQTLESLLAVTLKQLAWNGNSVSKHVKNTYNHHRGDKTHRLGLEALYNTLELVIPEFKRVFIVVDALDECPSPELRNGLISRLHELQKTFGISILFTSRPDQDIESRLQGALVTEVVAKKDDLWIYLDHELSKVASDFMKQEPRLMYELKSCIIELADGIFLVARLFLDLIMESDLTSENDLRRLINTFSGENQTTSWARTEILEGLYVTTMERIQHRRLAMRALLWVSCTHARLTTHALQHAIVMMDRRLTNDPTQWLLPSSGKIISECAGLVTVDTATDEVRLVHGSVQQYLDVTRDHWFPNAEADITAVCLSCISNYSSVIRHEGLPGELPQSLSRYATSYWEHHARRVPPASLAIIETCLDNPAKIYASIQAAQRSNRLITQEDWTKNG
ncbi:unnamed protein product [Clonostachys rosea]|uniref:Nucleoside phosphorylase domain-containing protein n=1 Tax=Bionectria ochroleuca TaxID=29856 RepID=A0ABY6UMC5_BIOOC|nr:unnamed protein product [Clonostachys rosea]